MCGFTTRVPDMLLHAAVLLRCIYPAGHQGLGGQDAHAPGALGDHRVLRHQRSHHWGERCCMNPVRSPGACLVLLQPSCFCCVVEGTLCTPAYWASRGACWLTDCVASTT